MDRKKKLRVYQIFFLIIGLSIIIITYAQYEGTQKDTIFSKVEKNKIDKQLQMQNPDNKNIFYNVNYSGLDLEGNRYNINSKEASNSNLTENVVNMKGVSAIFYFKDDTVLEIFSDEGDYNNKTLDMEFRRNVKALYENSELYAEKAEFLNSKNSLIVSNNVKVVDTKGSMFADRLTFDIKNKTLNITSLEDNMIKSKVNYKWKKVLEF